MNSRDNTYGLMANELVEKYSAPALKVVKAIQTDMQENLQQVQNISNTNRTMIRIANFKNKTPIRVSASKKDTTATIYVDYSENPISKIISLDNGVISTGTNTATMDISINGVYEFAVVDTEGNIRNAIIRVGDGTPELYGFVVDTTYLVMYNEVDKEDSSIPIENILKDGFITDDNNALVSGSIDFAKLSQYENSTGAIWYDYANQKWANIITRNNGNEAYFVWIPRYVYKLNSTPVGDESSNVKFVTTDNLDSEGNEVDLTSWTLPEAFIWENEDGEKVQIPGFWISKYQLSDSVEMGLKANIVGGINKIRINTISNTTKLANVTYDVYLYNASKDKTKVKIGNSNEEVLKTKVKKGNELQYIENIESKYSTDVNAQGEYIFEDIPLGEYEIRIVLRDSNGMYRGEEWFWLTVEDVGRANIPDLTGFRVNTTYVVTYTDVADASTMDASIPISEILEDGYTVDENTNALVSGKVDENKVKKLFGDNWYSYENQKWANIVVRNNGGEVYYTWIPRYIYRLYEESQVSEIKFIKKDGNVLEGWTLPEAFTWEDEEGNKVDLPGYWISKYQLSDKTKFAITADVIGGTNKIRISSINDGADATATSAGQGNTLGFKYKLYLYEADNCPKEYFAEPQAQMNNSDIMSDGVYNCNGKQFVRYSEVPEAGLKAGSGDIYYGLNAGTYNLRIAAYDNRGYYRGEQWFNGIEVVETGHVETTPDLTGFNKSVTYYVTYNEDGSEKLTPITQDPPSDWYDYNNSKWANILVNGNGKKAYFVWIPRYVYKLDNVREESEIKFIGVNEEIPTGWTLPEAFIWDGTQLSGYWISKYQLSE